MNNALLSSRWQLLLVLLACADVSHAIVQLGNKAYRPNTWYTKYPSYPEYCSTPIQMSHRAIPKLQNHPLMGETRLLHVTAIIRHGARTPWSNQETCWNGYWNSTQDTATWDCELTTVTAPPDPNTAKEEEGDMSGWLPDDAFFLFEKKFDALLVANEEESSLRNELNGTCEKGQMILQGYEQQLTNGKMIRDAYGYYTYDFSHDERMRLLDLSLNGDTKTWDKRHLYFRADDDQRTVMSGQVLLRGIFDMQVMEDFLDSGAYPQVIVHTADRSQDVLDANPNICPRLRELQDAALQSLEYQQFNNSDEMETLRWFARDKLGTTHLEFLDCLMTTICTDRTLPPDINDYVTGKTDSMFTQLAQADIQAYNLVMKYNHSAYAKLAMAPLWAEIMDNIRPWLQPVADAQATPGPKFALFSGHDTTIMPLLASLDPALWEDTEWAPYASMMLIEIHELIDGISDRTVYKSDFAFRLLYNGRILTPSIPGCPPDAELCDVTHFQALVDPIATRDPDCRLRHPAPAGPPPPMAMEQAQRLMNTTQGVFMFLGLVVFGMLVGAIGTYVLLTGRVPGFRQRVLESTEVGEDSEARQGLRSPQHRNYFDTNDARSEPSDEDDEDGFVDALTGRRIDSISTGLQ